MKVRDIGCVRVIFTIDNNPADRINMTDPYNRRNATSFCANYQRRSLILCCTMLACGLVCALLLVFGFSHAAPQQVIDAPLPSSIVDGTTLAPPTSTSPSTVGLPTTADPATENLVLKQVHTVFRHGPRTPADTYPTDPHINATFWPFGWGHLTNDGKQYMYDTGLWLQDRYGDFLDDFYVPDSIWAQTTGVVRTQMSMALVLAGLLPPKDTPMQWNPTLNWQPVPIFSEPLDQDTLLLVRTPCPRYYEALDEVFQTPELQAVLADNADLFHELTQQTGMSIATPDDVQSLYSTLRAEQEYGLQLPAWTTDYYPERLVALTEASYVYNVHTDELKKFKAGPFVRKMVGEWRQRSSGQLQPAARKMFLYTGHDSTIVNVLAALDVWQQQMPVYGFMAIFELWEDTVTHEWGVKIFQRRSATGGAEPLTIPGCEHFCALDKLDELTKKLLVVDLRKECEPKNKDFTTPAPSGP